jgi:hypothetical protein
MNHGRTIRNIHSIFLLVFAIVEAHDSISPMSSSTHRLIDYAAVFIEWRNAKGRL